MIIISLEGPDFSGKSTLATALLLKLREKGLKAERTELPSRLITGMFTSLLRNSKIFLNLGACQKFLPQWASSRYILSINQAVLV